MINKNLKRKRGIDIRIKTIEKENKNINISMKEKIIKKLLYKYHFLFYNKYRLRKKLF